MEDRRNEGDDEKNVEARWGVVRRTIHVSVLIFSQ